MNLIHWVLESDTERLNKKGYKPTCYITTTILEVLGSDLELPGERSWRLPERLNIPTNLVSIAMTMIDKYSNSKMSYKECVEKLFQEEQFKLTQLRMLYEDEVTNNFLLRVCREIHYQLMQYH